VEGPKGDKGDRGLQGPQGDPGATTWDGILNKPVTFPIESHYHEISDITNLSGQLASKQPLGNYAELDSSGRVPSSLLPSFVDDVIEVDSFAGLIPSIGSEGKIYVVKGAYDSGDGTGSRAGRQFRWGGTQYVEIVASPGSTTNVPEGTNLYFQATRVLGSVLTGFTAAATNATLAATDTVLEAFGKVQKQISDVVSSLSTHTTNVNNPHSVTKTQVGLGNCDNTSDLNKPISTATQTALDTKQATISAGTIAQYYRGDKAWATLDKSAVDLGNVDNTSDANKPISTATQTALDGKAASSHTHDDRYYTETEMNTLLAGKQASGSYAPATHQHAISDTTGLQTALDGKQASGSYAAATHTHDDRYYTETEMNTLLAGKQASGSYVVTTDSRLSDARTPTSHNHDASNIISGTLANDRLPARLGATAQSISDWNVALENGWYQGSQAANAPEGVLDWWIGHVEVHNALWVTQTVHRFTADAPTNTHIWRRSSSDNGAGGRTWGAWYKLQLSQAEQDARYSALVAVTTPDNIAPVSFAGRQLSQVGARNGKYEYFYDDGNGYSYGVYWVPEPQNDSGRWVAYESYSGDGDSYTEYWATFGQGSEIFLSPFPYNSSGSSFTWNVPNTWSSTGVQVTRVGTYTGQYSTALAPAKLGVQGSTGTATTAARADHVHALPSLFELGAASEQHTHSFQQLSNFTWSDSLNFPARSYPQWSSFYPVKDGLDLVFNAALNVIRVRHFENAAGAYIEFRKYVGSFGTSTDSVVGSITKNANGTAVAYNTTSDYRLKTNIEPLTDAVARLLQIPVHRFNWLADPDGPKVDGFLAHEAQAIVPESVVGTKDGEKTEEYEVTPAVKDENGEVITPAVMGTRTVPDYQGIDQSKLVPLLVAAVQELAAEVAALKAKQL
jgi:hypothetical protein